MVILSILYFQYRIYCFLFICFQKKNINVLIKENIIYIGVRGGGGGNKKTATYFLCRPLIFIKQLLQYHFPFGTVLRSTHAKWNHSTSQSVLSHATISP